KHTTALLILPGGRREPGESSMDTLEREVREELGGARVASTTLLGLYRDVAAGGPGEPVKTVEIELYQGELAGEPVASSEIRELVWFGPGDDGGLVASSIANQILPDLIRRGILDWDIVNPQTA